ncbi:MAG: sugar phosphate isomerase/epimerase [Steroidobacteraceae bacterium]
MQAGRRQLLTCAALAPLALAARRLPAAAAQRSVIDGVILGVQTYSFHDILDDGSDHSAAIIERMLQCGLSSCELFAPQVEPGVFTGTLPPASQCPKPDIGCPPNAGGSERNGFAWVFQRKKGDDYVKARAAQRAFRESKPRAHYEAIRRRFDDAGIELFTYNPMFDLDCTDAEIDGIFYAAKALGVKGINASIRVPMLKRAIPFAEKHQVVIAPHGHSVVTDLEDFSTRKTFTDAFALSKWVWANLDIGHYVASGEDPLEFIQTFHDRITNLHIKDRQKNRSATSEDGANVPWGTGDTPIAAVLRLLRDKRYKIPAFIEIEHIGTTTAVGEVIKAYDYCKQALAGTPRTA